MVFDHVGNFICYLDTWKVLLYSSLISNINNFDDDYLIMWVKFMCYIILLTCSISEADASMDLMELQINEMK
jgi:hypothetical protein